MPPSPLQDHAQFPRHRREVLDMEIVGHAANPMCADIIDMGILVENGVIMNVAFTGKGCALCVGSASLLCEYVRSRRVEEVHLDSMPHLLGETVGRMREGCVRVSVTAFERALRRLDSRDSCGFIL